MYQRIKTYIQDHKMLDEKDKVIAGVSGGADSICLLFVLLELKKEIGFSLAAVHVHHGIRGDSASDDENFVREVCRRQHVELFVFHEDVRAYAKRHRLSEEEAGRAVRRSCFSRVLEEQGGTKIALAHHENDNAETMIWNLCRGSGLKGLAGIAPQNGVWIHPLLCVNRAEIELYLKNRGISYCTDETNLENDYTRNKIRNAVIPYLEANVNTQAVRHMNACAQKLRMAAEYIGEEVKRYSSCCIHTEKDGTVTVEEAEFSKVPEALKPDVIYEAIAQAAGKKKDIESKHVTMACELLRRQTGRTIYLPYGLRAQRTYGGLCFCRKEEKSERQETENSECVCRMRIIERNIKTETFPQKNYTKWFDYDIIKSTVKIRHRQPGDYIVIDKYGNTQKLKQYFINEKIPANKRNDIWLVADGSEIMWIVGYRQSQAYQISKQTKKILEIEFYGGEKNVRDNQSADSGRGCRKKDL